jgi:hypothetical protein
VVTASALPALSTLPGCTCTFISLFIRRHVGRIIRHLLSNTGIVLFGAGSSFGRAAATGATSPTTAGFVCNQLSDGKFGQRLVF